MDLKILSLNCQWAYNQEVKKFLKKILETDFYDFLLLQEANEDIIRAIQGSQKYQKLGAFNKGNQKQSWLYIFYKKNFTLKQSSFISFAQMSQYYFNYPQLGFLIGTFEYDKKNIVLGSVHLHPGYHFRLRSAAVNLIKKHILTNCNLETPIIFGGDFNTGFPFEGRSIRKILSPEFFDSTKKNGPTLNSRYTENGTHFLSKLGNLLSLLGINVSFRTDKIFVDQKTAKNTKTTSKVFPDRISDHSPVELILKS
jgi:endonuclease/exonuclease/phosphatase (EEP) superfamily protein YafD